jgi:hypothetical protein
MNPGDLEFRRARPPYRLSGYPTMRCSSPHVARSQEHPSCVRISGMERVEDLHFNPRHQDASSRAGARSHLSAALGHVGRERLARTVRQHHRPHATAPGRTPRAGARGDSMAELSLDGSQRGAAAFERSRHAAKRQPTTEIAARTGPCRLSLGPPLPGPLLRRLTWPGERQKGWPSQANAGPKYRGQVTTKPVAGSRKSSTW